MARAKLYLQAGADAIFPEALTDAVRKVLRDVETWTGDCGPQDDISLVASLRGIILSIRALEPIG